LGSETTETIHPICCCAAQEARISTTAIIATGITASKTLPSLSITFKTKKQQRDQTSGEERTFCRLSFLKLKLTTSSK
jgi:hypothetical protein